MAASGLAARAAQRCGITVEMVHDAADAVAAADLLRRIWRTPEGAPVAHELLLALAHTGNYACIARRDGEVVGASAAFRAGNGTPHLHSHITGVAPGHRGRSVGYAIKLDQRAWALGQALPLISWTFDPMQHRNAYFNVVKLGASLARYLPDFYGPMGDAINRGALSDRGLVEWDLRRDLPAPAPVHPGEASAAEPLVRRDGDGIPRVSTSLRDPVVSILIPDDVGALRSTDPALANAWHLAVRGAFLAAFAAGYRVTGFDPVRSYILRRPDDHASATS